MSAPSQPVTGRPTRQSPPDRFFSAYHLCIPTGGSRAIGVAHARFRSQGAASAPRPASSRRPAAWRCQEGAGCDRGFVCPINPLPPLDVPRRGGRDA